MPGLVVGGHRFELKFPGTLRGNGQADQTPGVRCHLVDAFGRGELRGDDDVALVLAIVGIDQDEGPAIARFVDNLIDSGNRGHGRASRTTGLSGHVSGGRPLVRSRM